MSNSTPPTSDAAGQPDLPQAVADHELAFGHESTSGHVLLRSLEGGAVIESCSDDLARRTPVSLPQEQIKPNASIRV